MSRDLNAISKCMPLLTKPREKVVNQELTNLRSFLSNDDLIIIKIIQKI